MNNEIIKLAVYLLRGYADDLSNNGCNDPSKELTGLVNKIGVDKFNKMATEMNNGEVDAAENYDWLICLTVAHELNKLIKP